VAGHVDIAFHEIGAADRFLAIGRGQLHCAGHDKRAGCQGHDRPHLSILRQIA
jgi:hypothetical protein